MVPYKTLHATDSRVNGATTNGDTARAQLKSGYLLGRATLKHHCQSEHLKLITMFILMITANNQPEGIQNLPGTGAGDCETHSDELSSSGHY